MSRIAIVTNLNGRGLETDYQLLANLLSRWNHQVTPIQYSEPYDGEENAFDLAIYLEVLPRNKLDLARVKWAWLNPEWCVPETIKLAARHLDQVFAKTHEAERIFTKAFGDKARYTGFLTRIKYDPTIERQPKFLHLGGESSVRGTQALIDAYRWQQNGKRFNPPLVILGGGPKNREGLPDDTNIQFLERVNDEEVRFLQNSCLYHIYPSGTEGWGHALREAFGVGATVLTTDAPPMNELESFEPIPTAGVRKMNLADIWEVDARNVQEAMCRILEIEPAKLEIWGKFGIEQIQQENDAFEQALARELEPYRGSVPVAAPEETPKQLIKRNGRIPLAFIGNFRAPESTENMILWALTETLDAEVETLQENETSLSMIKNAMKYADGLIWVRTPGWLGVADQEMTSLLKGLRVPSISIHLDRFWDLPEREMYIGCLPFWRTQFVFTADGGNQERFKQRGVNHYWMRPAVSEVYCHPGTPRQEYACQVGFVGARDYHREYPFRKQLVDHLERTYGDRFKHVTNLRGHGLNDFYASARVVVGDCIFAGAEKYWSDRVPETTGRYGWLVHPLVEGLKTPVPKYSPQSLPSLDATIEMALSTEEGPRRAWIKEAAAYTLEHDTWTVRMREILTVANLL